MPIRHPKWEYSDNVYSLKSEFCYPGTTVEVRKVAHKHWHFVIVNDLSEPQTPAEAGRVPGQATSRRLWPSPGTAKGYALAFCQARAYLESAGISFKH